MGSSSTKWGGGPGNHWLWTREEKAVRETVALVKAETGEQAVSCSSWLSSKAHQKEGDQSKLTRTSLLSTPQGRWSFSIQSARFHMFSICDSQT